VREEFFTRQYRIVLLLLFIQAFNRPSDLGLTTDFTDFRIRKMPFHPCHRVIRVNPTVRQERSRDSHSEISSGLRLVCSC